MRAKKGWKGQDILELKECAIAFTAFLATFTVTVTLKIVKFCCRLSLFVFVYFYRYFPTYKNSTASKHDKFSFFYWYYWNYKIALPVAVVLFLFEWHTCNWFIFNLRKSAHILFFLAPAQMILEDAKLL